MIDTEALRKKVIDLAIQGKLTEQLPSDGDAETLYAQIQEEKAKQIKEGKIKKEKQLPEITEDDIPFEIPDNWKWVRLNSIGSWSAGATPSRRIKDYYENGVIPWLKTGELNDGYVNEAEEYISELAYKECSVRINPIGSVLIAMYGATIGKVGILDIEAATNQACCACIPFLIDNRFLFFFLKANKERFLAASHGGAQPNISKEIIIKSPMPLPPIAEQRRIVEIINTVWEQIDIIEELQAKYSNDLLALKSKIIDAGIQGKLTEQLSEDGDAETLYEQIQEDKTMLVKEGKIKKEKTLADITTEEIPYEIPKNWKWVRLGGCINLLSGQDFAPDDYNSDGFGMPYMTGASNVEEDGLIVNRWTPCPKNISHMGDLLLVCKGSGYGKTAFNNIGDVHIARQFMAITGLSKQINLKYIRFVLDGSIKTIKGNGQGIIPGIDRPTVLKLLLPLPPYEEQERIVAKVESILEQIY